MSRSGFSIGQLYGIRIRVNWSWIFILLLVAWNLSAVFRQVFPQWHVVAQWAFAFLGALLFFASVLIHELAHSLVALSQGLPVRDITLYLLGGVSNIQREPANPKGEFWLAIAGPLASLGLGFVLLTAGAGVMALAKPDGLSAAQILAKLTPLSVIFLWVGSINVILGLFNLIPGLPLDGGRVLRAFIWHFTHDPHKATRLAAGIGRGFALLMIAAGIAMGFGLRLPILGTGLASGIWLAFIGWFLNNASTQLLQQAEVQSVLEGVPVARLMNSNPPTVPLAITIVDLIDHYMLGTDNLAFPVMDGSRLAGMISVDDVRKVPKAAWGATQVNEIMTPATQLATTAPEEAVSAAIEKLIGHNVHQLVVVRPGAYGGELLGLLRRQDIMRWLQTHSNLLSGRQT